jgi:putative heme-binding domain-containing protein
MPAFHSLSQEQVSALVQYLHVLEGTQQPRVLPGDANRGRQIFFGKGECSSCHSIGGEGGFLGPDLSAYGSTKSAKDILDDTVKTNRIIPTGYKLAVATTRDGNRLQGLIRNEDNFSVQMQATDGSFHFLQKADLQKLEILSQPLMPTNYGDRLSPGELNDVVSYLMSAASSHEGERTSRHFEDDNE